MRIGIIIGRIGGVDGVALETEKWIDVLEKIGHKVFIMSGEFESWTMDYDRDYLFPALSFFSVEAEWGQRKAFFEPDKQPDALLEHVEKASNRIHLAMRQWVTKKKIDVILSENASALPCHLSMGVAIKKLVETTGIPIVTHDHDFHWERGQRYVSVHPEVNHFVDKHFPLLLPNVKHAVINTFGVETFKNRFDIDALLVPNVMDFNRVYGVPTPENEFFLRDVGVLKDEIALLQVTRIVRRKGIETAISLIDQLNDKKLKLVITGNNNDDENKEYYNELIDQIHDLNLSRQVIFAAHKVLDHKDLSDVYAHGRAATYFSTYEGFGNAFVETVLAKKPIFVNNYKPVYMQDIGNKGFETVMIEDSNLTPESIQQMSDIIYNPKRCKEIGEYNFNIGKKYFSYEVLEEKLSQLFTF
ncbi:glycosyltransferase family 4 protein [Winogradskyella sediminis]|uniref:Glycosyltransferase involved in cell wall bisynthesis n=1 Tax=Winogradskyella sediminis TaxID=1382466 RepID=A0A1H1NS32_9FLAO|nr:glycosyltransferase family 4 protein [Winogradskyella sediminis]SDS01767.1 Glycosyltransferase involved in cell wall bisynthesis [Winogradskyella sediminis]